MQSQRTFTPHGAPIRNAKLLPVQPPGQVIGRKRELGAIHTALKGGQSVLLTGQPGIGKTALAAVLATVYSASNQGGALWFNIVEDDIETLIARVGRAYGVNALTTPGSDWTNSAEVVRALLAKNRPLIVFDGLVDLNAAAEFVRQVADKLPVVITNEMPDNGPWTEVRIEPLPEADSEALFRYYSDLHDSLFTPDVQGLCKFLGGLPLAIELAARQVKVDNVTPAELMTLLPSSGGQDSQFTVMSVVFKRLTPPVQAMLLMLAAAFSGSATAELMSDFSRMPTSNIVPLMRQLATRALVREYVTYGQLAYALHESVQAYTRQWLSQYQRLQLTENRALQGVLAYVERHAHNTTADHDRLAAEITNIVGAAAYATSVGQPNPVHLLLNGLNLQAGDFVTLRGFQPEVAQIRKLSTLLDPTLKRKSQTASAVRATSTQSAAQVPSSKPSVATAVTQPAQPAPVTQPVSHADTTQVSQPTGEAQPVPTPTPAAPEAEPLNERATPPAPAAESAAAPESILDTLQNFVSDETQAIQPTLPIPTAEPTQPAASVPEPAKALPAVPEATPLAERDDIQPEAPRLPAPAEPAPSPVTAVEVPPAESLPTVAPSPEAQPVALSEPAPSGEAEPPIEAARAEEAQAPVEQPAIVEPPQSPDDTESHTPISLPTVQTRLQEARAANDLPTQAKLLQTLGQYYADQGNRDEALSYYKQALSAYETLDDTDGILASLDALATLTAQADDVENALVYATRGVNLAQKIGDKTRLGRLQTRLGDVRLALDDTPAAIESYTQAIESLRGTENWLSIGTVLSKLGSAYLEQSRPQEASMMFDQALVIFRKEQRADYESRVLGNLGAVNTQLNQWAKAQEYYQQALNLSRTNGDQTEEAAQLAALAHLSEMQNDRAGAILHYRQALHAAYVVDDQELQAACALELGRLLMDETPTLMQAAQLLREANALIPSDDSRRLLSRIDKRLERTRNAGVPIPPATSSNRDFAAAAYAALDRVPTGG
ncbi:MAG: tetratricopeptide repeat protein [Anaerolineae bacterium]|nr:tetratricopeptide repeat protein [Anaerolineae bacterium]